MSKFAVEQTVYWVIQEDETFHVSQKMGTVTAMVYTYANQADAAANDPIKKIGQQVHTLPIHGSQEIKEQHYIDALTARLGGTKINL